MSSVASPRPVVLCVLDGWGHRTDTANNAIALANTPFFDRATATCPHALLKASAGDVGLPDGQMGNSEVGHMNIGAGRVVLQDLPRVDAAIADGSLYDSPAFRALVTALAESGGRCHLLGLLSPGGVHAHQDHIAALANALSDCGIDVVVHAFLDGRDTPPRSADGFLRRFLAAIDRPQVPPRMGSICGRYFAMDRDKRWDRVGAAYEMLVAGGGRRAADALGALAQAYAKGETDEFVQPTALGDFAGMDDGDAVLMANFRADRAREIMDALVDPAFEGFPRSRRPRFVAVAGMVSYSSSLDARVSALLPPEDLRETLGEVVAGAGLRQLRIAETEKYAHVTFFFNGGSEAQFAGEDRLLVPSPKVATYDLKPEMSAGEVTDKLVEAIASGRYDFILVNYANTDMVGHTGDLAAAIRAVETVDGCLDRLARAVEAAGGTLLVTADHGNAELMYDAATAQAHTAHTTELVPCLLVNAPAGTTALRDGRLADVAPTVLDLLGLPRPAAMSGRSLIDSGRAAVPAAARRASA